MRKSLFKVVKLEEGRERSPRMVECSDFLTAPGERSTDLKKTVFVLINRILDIWTKSPKIV
jgi:hypothetical protein